LNGYLVNDQTVEAGVIAALERLADPQTFATKYGVGRDEPVLLFAMGDGNHSLATAKAIWEKNKAQVGMEHPSRYALVEIENVHDEGLEFSPIHRVLFNQKQDILAAMKAYFKGGYNYTVCEGQAEMVKRIEQAGGALQSVGMITLEGWGTMEITNPTSNLPWHLQEFWTTFEIWWSGENRLYPWREMSMVGKTARKRLSTFRYR
jgi:hypothetical protein